MTRKSRNWFPGAKFHITSRGIRKSALFYEEEDYQKYLSLLEETRSLNPFTLYTYCLMTNHTHLQVETLETPPSIIMKNLNTKYAKYFNKKYEFSGHVFEKRYGAELIDTLDYELDVSKYIHLNPLKAGIVKVPEDYPWSSYRSYVHNEQTSLIDTAQILSYFPSPQSQHYEHFLNAPLTNPTSLEFFKFDHETEGQPCGQK